MTHPPLSHNTSSIDKSIVISCKVSSTTKDGPDAGTTSVLTLSRIVPFFGGIMGQCPATGEELTVDDLLELRSDKAVKPRPVEAASIPGLLAIMQV